MTRASPGAAPAPRAAPHRAHGRLIATGAILVLAGSLVNQYSLAMFAEDGEIVSTKSLAIIWAFQLVCIVSGAGVALFRARASARLVC